MPRMHSGCGVRIGGDFVGCDDGAYEVLEQGAGDDSRAKKERLRLGEREHGGFDAHLARPAVEDEGDIVAEAAANMFGGRGRKLSESIGAGSGQRYADLAQQGQGDGVVRHAQSYGGEAGGNDEGDSRWFTPPSPVRVARVVEQM